MPYSSKIAEFVVPLLRMLQPDIKNRICQNVVYLKDIASPDFW